MVPSESHVRIIKDRYMYYAIVYTLHGRAHAVANTHVVQFLNCGERTSYSQETWMIGEELHAG